MRLLDPALQDLTPHHLLLYWRYQVIRTIVDFCAAMGFVIGSACFFFTATETVALWMFLVGSLLFGVKPTIDVIRSAHLRRLPGQADSPLRGIS